MNTINELSRKAQEITPAKDIAGLIKAVDWNRISDNLDAQGFAVIENLIAPEECEALANLYPRDEIFRSRVVMERHGFGRGEYKYFSYPLPGIISELRISIYPWLAPIANRWNEAMRIDVRYPVEHAEFIKRCHEAGQCRPTPLLLQYEPGDYNCLHQDLYGEHVFPIYSPTERFFRSLKYEQLNYEKFRTKEEAKLSIVDYLAFYNGKRSHSKLGYQSPLQFERMFYRKTA